MKQRPGDDRGWGRGFDQNPWEKWGDDGKSMEKNMEKWETNGRNPWEKSWESNLLISSRVFRDIFKGFRSIHQKAWEFHSYKPDLSTRRAHSMRTMSNVNCGRGYHMWDLPTPAWWPPSRWLLGLPFSRCGRCWLGKAPHCWICESTCLYFRNPSKNKRLTPGSEI